MSVRGADSDYAERQRAANLRTARALFAVPALFFGGTIATQLSDAPDVAVLVLGVAGLLFVAQTIAGHLRDGRQTARFTPGAGRARRAARRRAG